jgi:hypothetical protein
MANGITFQVLKYEPSIGAPDDVLLKAVMTGDYATAQGGTVINLNPSAFADPNGVGVLGEPLNPPVTPPSIESCQLANGVYAELTPGTTLVNSTITLWDSEGSEFGNAAYPVGTLVVKLPLR